MRRHCNTLPASDSAPDVHISRPNATAILLAHRQRYWIKVVLFANFFSLFLEGRGSLTTVRNFGLFPVVGLSLPKLLLYSLFLFFFCLHFFIFVDASIIGPHLQGQEYLIGEWSILVTVFFTLPLGSLDKHIMESVKVLNILPIFLTYSWWDHLRCNLTNCSYPTFEFHAIHFIN